METRLCPICHLTMFVADSNFVQGSASMDSPQTITASGINLPGKEGYVCLNCGHTETKDELPHNHS